MMAPDVVQKFNELFADQVGVWVDPEGVTTFRTCNAEIKVKDGRVIDAARYPWSFVSVPYWLRQCERPETAFPWSNEEVEMVTRLLIDHRSKMPDSLAAHKEKPA